MTKRASLPGADELFRRTSQGPEESVRPAQPAEAPSLQDAKATNLQVAEKTKPRHDEKVTFYCTGSDLTRLERVRLSLRSEHQMHVDRGRLVRAALEEVLEDFELRGPSSLLLRRLQSAQGS